MYYDYDTDHNLSLNNISFVYDPITSYDVAVLEKIFLILIDYKIYKSED